MNAFSSIINNFGIDWKIFLTQLINFGIVFFVLKRFAFSPVQKLLRKRQAEINNGLDNAKRAKSELVMAKEFYEEEIKKARAEANQIISRAQKRHDEIMEKVDKESQDRINRSIQEAKKEIQEKKEEMISEAKGKIVELTILATKRFLKGNFDTRQNQSFIKEIIKEEG